jgi:hypothetical protein
MDFVNDSIATTEDSIGNLMQVIDRLDYELDVLVNQKATQDNRPRLAKIAEYRRLCSDFMHGLNKFITDTDKFKEVLNA